MKLKNLILILIILFLALFLRTWRLPENPPSLYWDEVAIGYNAYSLGETGKDEYGHSWPILFESFEDFKLPGYIYTTAVLVKILGLNEWSVRLPSAILGTLTVLLTYFLVKELFPRRPNIFYLLPTLFLAISPWALQFSRAGFEANGGLTFNLLGIFLLSKAFKNPKFYLWSGLAFILSLYFYYSGRVFLPLFLLVMILIFPQIIWRAKKEIVFSLIVAGLLFLPLSLKLVSSQGLNRLSQVSLFAHEEIKNNIFKLQQEENFSLTSRLLHSRYQEYFLTFLKNYLSHFSASFLFFEGDPQERHSTRGLGMLYLWELPFIIFGLLSLLKPENNFGAKIVLPWLLLAPLAASLALPSPHALRSLITLPSWQILTALGVYEAYLRLKNKSQFFTQSGVFILILVVIFSFLSYQENYWQHSKKQTALAWADGYRQLFDYLGRREKFYDRIVITGEYWRPYIFALFYLKYPPASYQQMGEHSHFGQFYFGHAGYDSSDQYYHYQEVPSLEDFRQMAKTLLVLAPNQVKPTDIIVDKIYSISGKEVFDIIQTEK